MIQSPQVIQVRNGDAVHEATVSWHGVFMKHVRWTVEITSPAFEPTSAEANDAFEALCLVRDQLEPQGWRIGVAGAQIDVYPSGMARDQGGGKRGYRWTAYDGPAGLVDTFQPVDPLTVVTTEVQRADYDRRCHELRMRRGG